MTTENDEVEELFYELVPEQGDLLLKASPQAWESIRMHKKVPVRSKAYLAYMELYTWFPVKLPSRMILWKGKLYG